MDIDLALLGVGFLAVFLAGVVRGLTGFGFALVAVPVLSLMLSPKVVVPLAMLHMFVSNIPLLVRSRRQAQPGHIWPLMAASIAGVPFGSYLLLALDADVLRLIIGAVVTVFAVLLILGVSCKVRRERLAFVPVGFVSGVLSGSVSLSGPPVVLFFSNQGLPPQTFRANLLAYFLVLSLMTIIAFAVGGLFTGEVLGYALLFLPALFLGTVLGERLSRGVRPGTFRAVTLAVVTSAGVLSFLSGVGVL